MLMFVGFLLVFVPLGSVFTEKTVPAAPSVTPPVPKPKSASFEDVRCRCVCPKFKQNGTYPDRTVYIKDNLDPNLCKCQFVLAELNPTEKMCVQCECKFEERNTTTIKVVVIFTICVMSLLFVYMLFLLCLDPLITRRPTHYQQQSNEEVNLDDQSVTQITSDRTLTRQRSIINRVSDEQKRWKGTVQEQRKTIYDRHALLN